MYEFNNSTTLANDMIIWFESVGHAIRCAKILSGCGLNIYILYVRVISSSLFEVNFFKKIFEAFAS